MSEIAVKAVNISKKFQNIVALDKVSLTINKGEYAAIIGPSGSGKSTLLKCIIGLETPDSGDIIIFNRKVNDLPPEERGVGLIFQEIALFPHMSVRGNVAYAAFLRQPGNLEKIIRETLSALNMELRAKSLPRELSLGEQQKVAIARALASGARLLLMDEPYGSMDPKTAATLRHEVRSLAKSLGLTVIHVTHNQEEAMAVADKVAVMRKGRIEQVGTPLELYLKPKTLFVARFVGGENNFIECKAVGRNGSSVILEVNSAIVKAAGEIEHGDVILVVRPEKLRFDREGILSGIVETREFLGKLYKYVIKMKHGGRLVVKAPERVDIGVTVRLSFKPEDAIVFPMPAEGLAEAIKYE
ncbi:MAG: ABC transporter ATP-binding protein [Thermofilaceae archaeon]